MCVGDYDGSGTVSVDDLLIMLRKPYFNGDHSTVADPTVCDGDLSLNGALEVDDLMRLLGLFGERYPDTPGCGAFNE